MSETTFEMAGFLSMLRDLEKLSGRDFFEILVQQVGAILNNCIKQTHARTAADLARRVSAGGSYIEFDDGTIISVWKKAGAEMFFEPSNWRPGMKSSQGEPTITGGKSWHNMTSHHWSDARWARYQAALAQAPAILKQQLEEKKAMRGLTKKSWWQSAEDLGLNPGQAAAWVRAAHGVAKDHSIFNLKEGFAERLTEQGAAIIEIRNTNKLLTGKLDGHSILQAALYAREGAFIRELETGVFDDVKTRAERYPGIFTN